MKSDDPGFGKYPFTRPAQAWRLVSPYPDAAVRKWFSPSLSYSLTQEFPYMKSATQYLVPC